MKQILKLFVRGIPLAAGILLTLVSFVFIIELGSIDFEEEGFWGFVFFGLLGIPSIFVGLDMLCQLESSDRAQTSILTSKG
jgi:hypothetical protein